MFGMYKVPPKTEVKRIYLTDNMAAQLPIECRSKMSEEERLRVNIEVNQEAKERHDFELNLKRAKIEWFVKGEISSERELHEITECPEDERLINYRKLSRR